MKRRRKKQEETGAPKWMVTFSDLVTLILVFFILLFSMSQVDIVKFKAVAESFKTKLNFDFYPSVVPMTNPSQNSKLDTENGSDKKLQQENEKEHENESENVQQNQGQMDALGQLLKEINQFVESNNLSHVITATRNERGVVLVLQEKVLFNSGEAELLGTAKPFLDKVSTLLSTIPNPIKVEGHTDSLPISTYRYPSNWELSGARASSVINYLLSTNSKLENRRFMGVAYADTRNEYDNSTREGRQKNRKVEIVISDPTYDETALTEEEQKNEQTAS